MGRAGSEEKGCQVVAGSRREARKDRMLKLGGFKKGCLVIVGFFSPFSNEGFGNSKMVQCKKRIWFHQQVSSLSYLLHALLQAADVGLFKHG